MVEGVARLPNLDGSVGEGPPLLGEGLRFLDGVPGRLLRSGADVVPHDDRVPHDRLATASSYMRRISAAPQPWMTFSKESP